MYLVRDAIEMAAETQLQLTRTSARPASQLEYIAIFRKLIERQSDYREIQQIPVGASSISSITTCSGRDRLPNQLATASGETK